MADQVTFLRARRHGTLLTPGEIILAEVTYLQGLLATYLYEGSKPREGYERAAAEQLKMLEDVVADGGLSPGGHPVDLTCAYRAAISHRFYLAAASVAPRDVSPPTAPGAA